MSCLYFTNPVFFQDHAHQSLSIFSASRTYCDPGDGTVAGGKGGREEERGRKEGESAG
jgi:hypothetical protein